ncbi:hypothetical protein K7X08_031299 [Anisodus acutangulus]|uniref:Uncharacterized protein n=1 Tax=Anisodus acutangulus TaxID=402998 RepID=A0A9Q1RLK2_9SOLA|nr:hypothetical protein K7X08_031299 [Anisodus acutangulus]
MGSSGSEDGFDDWDSELEENDDDDLKELDGFLRAGLGYGNITEEQGQTVHIGGLVRLDLVHASLETIYVTVWASPSVSLHLGITENADELKNNHAGVRLQEVKARGTSWDVKSMDVAVAGLGWFSLGLKGEADLALWTYDGIQITLQEPLVLDRAASNERPGFWLPKVISEAIANPSKLEGEEARKKNSSDKTMQLTEVSD